MNPNPQDTDPIQSIPDPINPFKPGQFMKPVGNVGNKVPAPEELPGAMPIDDTTTPEAPITPDAPITPTVPVIPTSSQKLEPTPIFKAPVPTQSATPDFFPKPFLNPLAANVKHPVETIQTTLPTPPVANTPAKIPIPAPVPTSPVLKNIRTYESDVADMLAHRETSRASMAISESVKRGEGETLGTAGQTEKSHLGRNLTIIIISLILIATGMTVGYYLYSQSPLGKKPPAVTTSRAPSSIVNYESRAVISVDGSNRADLIKKIRNETIKPIAPGSIKEIVMTETKNGQIYRTSAPEMASIMTILAPDMILRTLNPGWMLGVYANTDGSDKSVFVIVTTNLFQNAFAGMLAWEEAIPEDLKDILSIINDKTFTPAIKGAFKDQIVKNKDVRTFMTDSGQSILVYSFVDNSTLVVTNNVDTLSAIITRLENKAFVR